MRSTVLLLLVTTSLCSPAFADDTYYVVTPDQLTLTQGAFPQEPTGHSGAFWAGLDRSQLFCPYAALDGPGEVCVQCNGFDVASLNMETSAFHITQIAFHVPSDRAVAGRLYVPKTDLSGMEILKFNLSASAHATTPIAFAKVKQSVYQHNVNLQLPGGAFFRYQANRAAAIAGTQPSNPAAQQNWRPADADDSISLFSGGRAVSENLQLDRALPLAAGGDPTIDVDSLPGISVTPMDWKQKNQGLTPALDPLASLIPADQLAVFFPSFSAFLAVTDEAERSGTPVLTSLETRSEDGLTRQRYEKQLGLSLTGLSRLLGPQLISGVALTASDPYLRVGSDVAILFDARDPAALQQLLTAQLNLVALSNGPTRVTADGPFFAIARNPDRSVCSYMAALGNTVIVTNSQAQFQLLLSAHSAQTPPLSSAPEYIFFRDRYKLGDPAESAFLILTDATIRRWCSPRYRIADSRRTRAAAILADLQAAHLDDLASGKADNRALHSDFSLPDLGDVNLTPAGVTSTTYGSLAFMTPIDELNISKVTPGEAEMYKRWRESYERNWRWFFDPIAVRLGVQNEKLSADLSVMPLIAGTEYAQLIDVVGAAKIPPHAADQHPDLLHFVLAIDKNSPTVHPAVGFISGMAPGLGVDPLGWLGQWISLYADDDPFWQQLADAKDQSAFFQANFPRLPVALEVDVSSRLKLTAFLVAVRAFVEQTAPQTVQWDSQTYKDQPYVKVSPTPRTIASTKELKDAAIYYAITDDALILTLSEPTLDRALDRAIARKDPAQLANQPATWLGQSFNTKIDGKMFDLIRTGTRAENESRAQALAWENLPILNEYKRLFPDQDPVKLHELFWHTRLLDPAGGQYVWNEEWQSMESTLYGNPGEPKDGPAGVDLPESFLSGLFGLTFEDKGLRAAAQLERSPAK